MNTFKSLKVESSSLVQSITAKVTKSSTSSAKSILKSVKAIPGTAYDFSKETFVFYKDNPRSFMTEVLSGVTVSILQVPESIAFSYVAGLHPIFGLYSTVFLGFITALFGGRGGMISGADGALAVVLVELTSPNGVLSDLSLALRIQHLLMTAILLGVIQCLFGLLNGASLIRLVPHTAMIGFLNGLAIVIFVAQLNTFQTCPVQPFSACIEQGIPMQWMKPTELTTWITFLITGITMGIMVFWSRVPMVGKMIPNALVALIVGAGLEHGINRKFIHADTRTIGETASVSGDIFVLHIPDLGMNPQWMIIIRYAMILAAIGIIEATLTLQILGNILNEKISVFKTNQECFAQGLAQIFCGVLGAMPGGAMIGQSTVNLMYGARGRLSGMVAGITVLGFIIFAAPAIELIPVAVLCGILFMIVIHTFYWPTFKLLFRIPISDSFCILIVTLLAVLTNLANAVFAGITWAALVNSWYTGKNVDYLTTFTLEETTPAVSDEELVKNTSEEHNINLETEMEPSSSNGKIQIEISESPNNVKTYKITGPIFFSSIRKFDGIFSPSTDPLTVRIDLSGGCVTDFSGVNALRQIISKYEARGCDIKILGVDAKSLKLIKGTKWIRKRNLENENQIVATDEAEEDDLEKGMKE